MAYSGRTNPTYHPRSKMRLEAFRNWLFAKGKSPSTVETYSKFVRAIFRSEEEAASLIAAPGKVMEEVIQHETALTAASRTVFRTAIRAFDAFWRAQGKPPLLTHGFPDRRTSGRNPVDDHPVAGSLRVLFARAPLHRIELLRWAHARHPGGPMGYIEDPDRGGRYQVPIKDLRQINLWAGGGQPADGQLPIVPKEPLFPFSMSVRQMRRFGTSDPLPIISGD